MKKNIRNTCLIAFILIVIQISTTWLFYKQSTGEYLSDLGAHINSALDTTTEQYTITKVIYRFLHNYLGGNIAICIFLSIMVVFTIYMTKKLLDYLIEDKKNIINWVFAILLNFEIAIYLPFIHSYFNVGVQEASEWHNSTFICMKAIGLLAMLMYFKMEEKYLENLKYYKYLLFTIVLIIVNFIKPNFILAFAPTMGIFLLVDLIKNYKDKNAWKNIFLFGGCVLISCLVLVYQNMVLFSEDSGSSIALTFMKILRMYNKHPIIGIIQSAAFPLFVLVCNIKTIMQNRKYTFSVLLNMFGLGEALFLKETGSRELDGNFDWGYSFTIMMAFIVALAIIRNYSPEEKKSKKIILIISYILLILHILSGLIYFYRLLKGESYY